MKLKSIPYKRFWYDLGKEIPLDEDGFLKDPDSEWYHVYFDGTVFSIDDLVDYECLLLLGEPGIGKTTELDKLKSIEKTKKHKSISFILRRYESKLDFEEAVFSDKTVLDWIENSNEPLTIYLDGLDEALLDAKKISFGVVDVIDKLKKHGRVFLRVTCRTSDLPTEFHNELSLLFTGNTKALELATLRREDVKIAANEHGIDVDNFLSSIYEKELGALGSRPITLNMLIQEYHKYGQISEKLEGVYEKGCLILLEDTEDRKKAGIKGVLTPSQRLMIAERIAAVLMLCNYSNLHTGSLRELTSIEFHIDEIDAGVESIPDTGEEVKVTKQAIDEVIHTSLFKPLGEERYSLTHQTFAEYLTARYLVRNQFKTLQLESLLLHEDGTSKGIIPQLKEVSMWLALMHDDFFQKLIGVDPFLLLKSSIDIHEKTKLEALILSLLKKISEINRVPNQFRYFKFLKNLEYDGIHNLVKKEFLKAGNNPHTKIVILDIVHAIGIANMADDLVNLALNSEEDMELREYALRVLSDLNIEIEKIQKLAVLLESPNDDEFKIISNMIKCLYPALVSTEYLIEILNRDVRLKDNILKYSGYHIIEKSENPDLVLLFNWAANNYSNTSFSNRDSADFFDNIILKGIKRVDNEDVKKSLARYIRKITQKFHRLFNGYSAENSYKELLNYIEERRSIVEEVVNISSNEVDEEEFTYKLRRNSLSLVVDGDFDWILNHVLSTQDQKLGKIWADILFWSHDISNTDQIEKILVNQENEFIKKAFHHDLTPIDIRSDEGKKARERHYEIWGKSKKEPEEHIKPHQLIEEYLNELRKGNIKAYYWLDRAFSLTPECKHYKRDFDLNVEEYSGWLSADKSLRNDIMMYAKKFIQKLNPSKNDWLNDPYSRVAYRAFRLIQDYEPTSLENISNEVWEKWLEPIIFFETSDGLNKGQIFLYRYFQKFREQTINFIIKLIKDENARYDGTIFALRYVDSILKAELSKALFDLYKNEDLKPTAKETIKEKLIEYGHTKTLEHIRLNLEKDNEDEYVINIYLLYKYDPNYFFEYVLYKIENNPELSKKIIAKLAFAERHEQATLKGLNEDQLSKLYYWFESICPAKDYPRYEGMTRVTTEMEIHHFKSYTLTELTGRGTEESCKQILELIEKLPNEEWLNYQYLIAQENYRRENWQPIKPESFMKLKNDSNKRYIKSEYDLLWVVMEKLDKLQKRLQNQEQSDAIIYWNTDPDVKPKDENFMSDRIKNFLTSELIDKEVIINREVEIEKGNKTDIHITAHIKNKYEINTLKLVIEVKGCWNKDLKKDFQNQLVDKYLNGKGIRTGIYLIGWFLCDKWDREKDYKYDATPKFTLLEAKEFFYKQRNKITKKYPQLVVKEFVLDLSI